MCHSHYTMTFDFSTYCHIRKTFLLLHHVLHEVSTVVDKSSLQTMPVVFHRVQNQGDECVSSETFHVYG